MYVYFTCKARIYVNSGWKRYVFRQSHPLSAAAAGNFTHTAAQCSAPTRRWVALPYGVPLPPALYTCKKREMTYVWPIRIHNYCSIHLAFI